MTPRGAGYGMAALLAVSALAGCGAKQEASGDRSPAGTETPAPPRDGAEPPDMSPPPTAADLPRLFVISSGDEYQQVGATNHYIRSTDAFGADLPRLRRLIESGRLPSGVVSVLPVMLCSNGDHPPHAAATSSERDQFEEDHGCYGWHFPRDEIAVLERDPTGEGG